MRLPGLLVGVGGLGLLLPTVAVAALATAGMSSTAPIPTTGAVGIAPQVIAGYELAASEIGSHFAGCSVPWWALAAVGQVEWHNGVGRAISTIGDVVPPVIGPPLDGAGGTAAIPATPLGVVLDGDPAWDHAVGPLQVLPSNWAVLGLRASGDGQPPDPQNVADSALTGALLLCRAVGGGDLSNPTALAAAAHGYNPGGGADYVDAVLAAASKLLAFAGLGTTTTVVGGFALPLPAVLLTPATVSAPHHTFPAVDIPVPVGTQVYAVAGGTVTTIDQPSSCGWGVSVRDAAGYVWTGCHASALEVSNGVTVTAGQPVMLSGGIPGSPGAGDATGPHLHLQLQTPAGALICPQLFLAAWLAGQALVPSPATWETACVA